MTSGLPIELALQPRIEAALAALREGSGEHCLSDHAFSNLYLFRAAHGYRFIDAEWPGIAGCAYDGTRHFMPLFAPRCAPLDVLSELIEAHGCLYPVAARDAAELPDNVFVATASADDADYLYQAETFVDYSGRPLAKKRNLVRQFLAAHEPSCKPFAPALADAARSVLQGWFTHKGKARRGRRRCVPRSDRHRRALRARRLCLFRWRHAHRFCAGAATATGRLRDAFRKRTRQSRRNLSVHVPTLLQALRARSRLAQLRTRHGACRVSTEQAFVPARGAGAQMAHRAAQPVRARQCAGQCLSCGISIAPHSGQTSNKKGNHRDDRFSGQ